MQKYYHARVKCLLQQNSTGDKIKFKSVSQEYLVQGNSISQAQKNLKNFIVGIYDDFEIVQIRQSRILAVVQSIKDGVS